MHYSSYFESSADINFTYKTDEKQHIVTNEAHIGPRGLLWLSGSAKNATGNISHMVTSNI